MLTVRPTIQADADILATLQKQAFAPLYERYHDQGNPCLRGVEDITRRLDTPIFRYFTILEENDIVGGVLYKCKGRKGCFGLLSDGEYYLQRIYIRPDCQGRKLAQRAILQCEQAFPDASAFWVDFPEDLLKNKRCYEAAGFRDTGERLEAEPGLVLACYRKEMRQLSQPDKKRKPS